MYTNNEILSCDTMRPTTTYWCDTTIDILYTNLIYGHDTKFTVHVNKPGVDVMITISAIFANLYKILLVFANFWIIALVLN
jgi:hypothetical protein